MTDLKYVHAYRKRHPERVRRLGRISGRKRDLKKRFGLTAEDYEVMVRSQNGGCAICSKVPEKDGNRHAEARALAVDHDHTTLENRGLLCDQCNRSLGLMRDDPKIFRSAAAYLESFATTPRFENIW